MQNEIAFKKLQEKYKKLEEFTMEVKLQNDALKFQLEKAKQEISHIQSALEKELSAIRIREN